MRRAATILILAASPFLLAADIVLTPEDDKPTTYDEMRAGLDQFNHDLDGIIESQIDEIAALDSTRDVEQLRIRKAHYAWKLKRDLDCAEKGLTESDRLAELECRSQADEKYYQDREMEIEKLEAKNRSH